MITDVIAYRAKCPYVHSAEIPLGAPSDGRNSRALTIASCWFLFARLSNAFHVGYFVPSDH